MDRACRLAPRDQTCRLALAVACLGHDDPRAAALFDDIARHNDLRETWVGLATARHRLGDAAGAAEALAAALRRHVLDPGMAPLADAIAREVGAPGWCGLGPNGEVVRRVIPADGSPRVMNGPDPAAGTGMHPGAGEPEGQVEPGHDGLLGSPIDMAAINATVGSVSCRDGGIVGWAWHPGNPARDPVLTVRQLKGARRIIITATDLTGRVNDSGLLARPRGFVATAEQLRGLSGPLRVLGADGRDLLGSPLHPRSEQRAVAAAIPVTQSVERTVIRRSRRRPVDVLVAVHGGAELALACINSALASLPRTSRLIVVDDASPEPDLRASLNALARQGRIVLIRHRRNRGFPASANAAIRAAAGNDVVLLNSDTLVAPGWLEELRRVAYSAGDIGTVTPFSNDGTLLSYPDPSGGNDVPDLATVGRIDALARAANGGEAIDIPVGIGFCLYIRHDCLDAVGPFRAELFAQGYGEENDFCLRARHRGWRHVAAPGAFVAHVGGQSFGGAARHLRARNSALLERLHPGYAALIQAHAVAAPLAEARRRLDLARWRALHRRGSQAVILVTHASGGGVERQVAASVERHRAAGRRPIVLRPSRTPNGDVCAIVSEGTSGAFPNLRFRMPAEASDLLGLLRRERPNAAEVHHLVGHHPAVLDILSRLGVPYDVHVHDYAWLCGRVALVGPGQRYCGEPAVARCEECIAVAGSLIEEDISAAALRRRSARLFAGARQVIAPSADAAARIRRHFPATRPKQCPHEDDAAFGTLSPAPTSGRICVIGAIGVHKGFHVLLDCARDADSRHLPLEFVVVGHTIDDRTLLDTGRVFITGEYAADEAVTLIKAQNAALALLPSVFPETWCFSVGEAWRAGLRVVAFDIGAQAERIRATGRGLLLPLGLPPRDVNDALITAAALS